VLKSIKISISFMTGLEKTVWFTLLALRSALTILDIAAIAAIGYLATSVATVISGAGEVGQGFEVAGIELPSVTVETIPLVSAIILALFISKTLSTVAITGWTAFFIGRIEARASKFISEIYFGGNLSDSRKYSLEEMMFAVTTGTSNAFNVLLNGFSTIVTEGILFVSLIVMGFLFVDSTATLAAVLYFGLVALIIQLVIGRITLRSQEKNYQSSIKLYTSVNNIISVFRELSVSGRKTKLLRDISESKTIATDSAAKTLFIASLPRHIVETALILGVAAFFLSQVSSGDIATSIGTIGIFLAGSFRLTTSLLPIQSAFLGIKGALPPAKIAQEILAGLPELRTRQALIRNSAEKAMDSDSPIGAVFENVTYWYPDSKYPALSDINIVIEPGSQTALMGPSGAGKSTIADILCLLIRPTSGRVFQITHSSNVEATSGGRVSYVPQKPGMISGTILENVALGIELADVDRDEVLRTLKAVHLGQLLESLPLGIDTDLGKLKDSLSGGQMQRLGLARALYSKPSLLVMDEATSALDAESESEIQKTLEEMRGKVTVVVIAHRLNTIQHADKVILLEEGRVQDSGTFKELIARNLSVEKAVDLMRIDEED
jgi:ABC-type multidrug transport system fused ATPase/permease subunit